MRRRIWPWLLSSLVVFLLLPTGVYVAILTRAQSILGEAREQALTGIDSYRRRPHCRKPFGIPPIEANAWDLYRKHLPRLQLDREEAKLFAHSPWDDERIGKVLESRSGDFAALRRGLRCTRLDTRLPYEDVLSGTDVIDVKIPLSMLIVEGAYYYKRRGQEAAGADLLLLGLGLARDLSLGTGIVTRHDCAGWEEQCLRGFRYLLEGHSMEPKTLHDLGASLDLLTPDPADDLATWDLVTRLPYYKFFDDPPRGSPAPDWRQLWSLTVARATAHRIHQEMGIELRTRLGTPSRDTPSRLERLIEEQGTLRDQHPTFLREDALFVTVTLIGRLHRTLARLAVAVAEFEANEGRFPAQLEELVPRQIQAIPIDPYTGQSFHTAAGKIWSVGADGVDNGGIGNPDNELDPGRPGTDVVITVRRKR